jgi:hypothetical protein
MTQKRASGIVIQVCCASIYLILVPLSFFTSSGISGVFRTHSILQDKYLISYGGYIAKKTIDPNGTSRVSYANRPKDGRLHVLNVDTRKESVLRPESTDEHSYPESRDGALWVLWEPNLVLMLFGGLKEKGEPDTTFQGGWMGQYRLFS